MANSPIPILSILIWLPIVTGLCLFLLPDRRSQFARIGAVIMSLIMLLLCIPLYQGYSPDAGLMQFQEQHTWIEFFKLNYALGVDGISVALIILTAITQVIIMMMSWRLVDKNVCQYLASFFLMQGILNGIFSSLDAILFYCFWEAVLIPMYLCIGVWGSQKRQYAAKKFFLYTFFGSVLMLIALVYLIMQAQSAYILDFYTLKLSFAEQAFIFAAFFMAFAIKVPMVPVHTWLPDAHTEAPTAGSVLLAALLLKLGPFGMLRFNLPITPLASHFFAPAMIVLSLIAIVYIGIIAIKQTDMKKLIAYSSIAHMGFVTLGLFMIFSYPNASQYAVFGFEGAVVQMIAHGFSSGALFLAFGLLYARLHTRKISDFGGIAQVMPYFTALFVLYAFSNTGLPGTAGFIGEFMVITAAVKGNFIVASIAATALFIGASYTLWMVRQTFYGPIKNQAIQTLGDLTWEEWAPLLLFAMLIIGLGVYPNILMHLVHAPSVSIVKMVLS